MELRDDHSFERVLCDFLLQERMPSRDECEVISVMIQNGDKASITQPGSGWPKQERLSSPKPVHSTLADLLCALNTSVIKLWCTR